MSPAGRPDCLHVVNGPEDGAEFFLVRAPAHVGSDPSCSVHLTLDAGDPAQTRLIDDRVGRATACAESPSGSVRCGQQARGPLAVVRGAIRRLSSSRPHPVVSRMRARMDSPTAATASWPRAILGGSPNRPCVPAAAAFNRLPDSPSGSSGASSAVGFPSSRSSSWSASSPTPSADGSSTCFGSSSPPFATPFSTRSNSGRRGSGRLSRPCVAKTGSRLETTRLRRVKYPPQNRSPVAQLVERVAVNHQVVGSSPTRGASLIPATPSGVAVFLF